MYYLFLGLGNDFLKFDEWHLQTTMTESSNQVNLEIKWFCSKKKNGEVEIV